MTGKTRKTIKIVEWVFPISIPLLAILIGVYLYRAIIEKNTIILAINIFSCLCIVGTSFINSRSLLNLGAIKAFKEMKRIRESFGLDKLGPTKN